MLSKGSSSFQGLIPKGNTLSEVGPSSSFLLSPKLRSWGVHAGLRSMERGDPGKAKVPGRDWDVAVYLRVSTTFPVFRVFS